MTSAVVIISHVEILLIFLKWFKWYTFFCIIRMGKKNLFVILQDIGNAALQKFKVYLEFKAYNQPQKISIHTFRECMFSALANK